MMSIEPLLEKAGAFHGDICPGIVTGTRMTIAGLRELGMNPHEKNRDLIVYVEIDRCATDAIQAITGCTCGHKTLKVMNYGKFAATFVDIASGKAVRIAGLPKKNPPGQEDFSVIVERLKTQPEEELFSIQKVKVEIPKGDLPGLPQFKEVCSACGEQIMDAKEVQADGKVMCKNCACGSYYTLI